MFYSLPTGKVIEISVEQYFELTDEELEYLISINYGEAIEDPFFGSILEKPMIIELPDKAVIILASEFPNIEEIDNSIDYTPEEE